MAGTYKSQISKLSARLDALEGESRIRGLVARYMEICDELTPETPYDELGELFSKDAVWVGTGNKYKTAFGGHKGREEIVNFLKEYGDPKPHFSSNVHFLTSENLLVKSKTATGSWVMLQTPTFSNEQSFVLAARLNLKFKVETGKWRISQFSTTNLFGRPVEGGWHSNAPIPTPIVDKN
ncbi:nuclear transport factor 2 family protein [Hirschia litorea]|uniref:Nuclear transport factor 2 family protein n=1 Tax=Hirschia litorea TaxID=1199156 RepID=A0ABW2IKI6_9PROT